LALRLKDLVPALQQQRLALPVFREELLDLHGSQQLRQVEG
jgi:hypothetical protein